MKSDVSSASRRSCCAAAMVGDAQQRQATDPRVGLKGGLRDAGQAARNMELVASLPKPDGFFDPKAPAGTPTPPERGANPSGDAAAADGRRRRALRHAGRPRAAGPPAFNPVTANALGFANSDLAFKDNHVFVGNYHGFNAYDIENGRTPRLVASIVCPGGQGDVSIHGNLLFMSVEQTRGRIDCGTGGVQTAVSAERFRGVRIFDISDVKKPKQLAAVQTCRGSHTHTLVVDPDDSANVYLYGSGTGAVRSGGGARRVLRQGSQGGSQHGALQHRRHPGAARRAGEGAHRQPAADLRRPGDRRDLGSVAGRQSRGGHADLTGDQPVPRHHRLPGDRPCGGRLLGQRHPDGHLGSGPSGAAGSRRGQELRLLALGHLQQRRHEGHLHRRMGRRHAPPLPRRPTCRTGARTRSSTSSIASCALRATTRCPRRRPSRRTASRTTARSSPCPGATSWCRPGIRAASRCSTSPTRPIPSRSRSSTAARSIPSSSSPAGYWSTYWYNGHIYGTEIARGIDVFRLKPSEYLSENEIAAAVLVHATGFNAQQQTRITWPASSLVARAYLDQLARTKGILPARASAVRADLERADGLRAGRDRDAPAVVSRLEALATQLLADASAASPRDGVRLRLLAATVKDRAAELR